MPGLDKTTVITITVKAADHIERSSVLFHSLGLLLDSYECEYKIALTSVKPKERCSRCGLLLEGGHERDGSDKCWCQTEGK